jgi:hypothetical protein
VDRSSARALIRESIIKSIQSAGKKGFDASQSSCPVVTGELKRSGSVMDLSNGIEVKYSAPYTTQVTHGQPAGPRHVKAHTRQGHPVRAYDYHSKGSKENPFIEKALTDSFSTLSKEFGVNLKSSFNKEKAEVTQ